MPPKAKAAKAASPDTKDADQAPKGATLTFKETQLLAATMNTLPSDISKAIDFDKVAVECGYKDASIARTMFQRLRRGKIQGNPNAEEADASKGSKKTKAPAKRKQLKANDDDDYEPSTPKRAKTNTGRKRTKKAVLSQDNAIEAENQMMLAEAAAAAAAAAENNKSPAAGDTGAPKAIEEGPAKTDNAGPAKEGNAQQMIEAGTGEKDDAGEKVEANAGKMIDGGEKATDNSGKKTDAGETGTVKPKEVIDAGQPVTANTGGTIDAGDNVAAMTGDKIDAGKEVVAASGDKIDASPVVEGGLVEKVVAKQPAEVEYNPEQHVAANLGGSIHAVPEIEPAQAQSADVQQDVVPAVNNANETNGGQEVATGVEEKFVDAQEVVIEQKKTVHVETMQEGVAGAGEAVTEKKEEVVVSMAEKVEVGQDKGASIDNQVHHPSVMVADIPGSVHAGLVTGNGGEQVHADLPAPAKDASGPVDGAQH
ncbi:MAG: hypothetical protein M1823_004402 [Watsoniomyces obsoletus]|nr:MAG: hypothetical protein M1823_004402 [Watsoniomyces obsoletus]